MEAEDSVRAPGRRRGLGPVLVWLPVGAYLLWTLGRVALHDSLTSISDDSSNYLVMAHHFSPWLPETEAIRSAWPLQYFPPLFPLILAATGAAHSLLAAHLLVLVLGLCGLFAFYRFMRTVLGVGRQAAHAACVLLALLPGFTLGLQGILSESLYLLLSLCFLLILPRPATWRALPACALLLALAILARSAGIVLALALLMQAVVGSIGQRRVHWQPLATVVTGLAVSALASSALQPERDAYARIWYDVLEMEVGELAEFAAAQVQGLYESWATFFLVYWSDDRPVVLALVAAVLVFGLVGTAMRLRDNRLDAWYAAGSLAMLLAWPYPGQMVRFLFPLVPVLMGHAVWLLYRITADRRAAARVPALCLALLLAAVLPAHAYLHGRLDLAGEFGLVPVYEWFRKPDLPEARRELGLQNQMMQDFALMPAQLGPDVRIAGYEPSYIALLGNRRVRPLGFPVDEATISSLSKGDAVMLTAIHPRRSRSSLDGLAISPQARHGIQLIRCSVEPLDQRPASCLLTVVQ